MEGKPLDWYPFINVEYITSIKFTSENIQKSEIFLSWLQCFFPQYYGKLIIYSLSLSQFFSFQKTCKENMH